VILENVVLTGLRGVGKTVLMDSWKPLASKVGWLWVGNDLSESTSVSEEMLALRVITDLAVVTASIKIADFEKKSVGFNPPKETEDITLNYPTLISIYNKTPGLVSDKLKAVLEEVWFYIKGTNFKGIIFAYDEAQNLSDRSEKDQYPLSMLLDIFQSIQKKDIPFLLLLTGLPTLFQKLVEARTFAERMFHVLFLDSLDFKSCRDAILIPVKTSNCPVRFSDDSVKLIYRTSGGYPYFVQFICREAFNTWTINPDASVPIDEIERKLDADFFSGRWSRATDRQRQLLYIIASLPHKNSEFTVQEIVDASKKQEGKKAFSSSHVTQMLVKLAEAGLVYKNRHGKYSFAVPLLRSFIKRQDPTSF
ncbi:MAG: ATP-binding protein, partial [Proteobacteria bacterium]|nr:ATP-binding protein [Pseudomonadota bacterium]